MKTSTTAIESLHTFASNNNEIEFANLCTAALAGEEWAMDLVSAAFAEIGAEVFSQYRERASEEIDSFVLSAIRSTDTTRPDGAIARRIEI